MKKTEDFGWSTRTQRCISPTDRGEGKLGRSKRAGWTPQKYKAKFRTSQGALFLHQGESSSNRKDALYDLLLESKTQSRFQDTEFLRQVNCAPEPASFLGNNLQINDIARYQDSQPPHLKGKIKWFKISLAKTRGRHASVNSTLSNHYTEASTTSEKRSWNSSNRPRALPLARGL